MCPNCPVNLAGIMSSGYWAAYILIVLFLIVAVGAIIWGMKSGVFKNIEHAKFKMLEKDPTEKRYPNE